MSETPPPLVFTSVELTALLEASAEKGARRALESVGLHDENAVRDVVELRSLLDSWRAIRREAGAALIGMVFRGLQIAFLAAVLAYIAVKTGQIPRFEP